MVHIVGTDVFIQNKQECTLGWISLTRKCSAGSVPLRIYRVDLTDIKKNIKKIKKMCNAPVCGTLLSSPEGVLGRAYVGGGGLCAEWDVLAEFMSHFDLTWVSDTKLIQQKHSCTSNTPVRLLNFGMWLSGSILLSHVKASYNDGARDACLLSSKAVRA